MAACENDQHCLEITSENCSSGIGIRCILFLGDPELTLSLLCLRTACVSELFSFFVRGLHKDARTDKWAPANEIKCMPGVCLCKAVHASRSLFEPFVGSLPSARHSSHVNPLLSWYSPRAFGRNCDRCKDRWQILHVIGFAAASMDAWSFFAVKPPALSFGGLGRHSLHLMLRVLVR